MQIKIILILPKKIAGIRRTATFETNNMVIREIWPAFMKCKNQIKNQVSSWLFSIQIFDNSFPDEKTKFEKWAAVEVNDFESVPENFDTLEIQGGLYAVFIHKGTASMSTNNFIFNEWLPNSKYIFDNREQFEIMPPNYHPDDPEAEEEIWIPIKEKE